MKRLVVFALLLSTTAHAQPPKQKSTRLPRKLPAKKQPVTGPNEAPPAGAPAQPSQKSAKKRIDLEAGNTIRLNYGYPTWNQSPTKIDSASLLMREGASGRMVQIYLEETAPDSSVFSGLYSINWENLEHLQVEFYIPPQNLLENAEGLKKIANMISSHELKRRPFLLRRMPGGLQAIEIYDTREQARAAMRAFRAEQQLQVMQNPSIQTKKYPSDSELEVANLATDLKEREAAAKNLSERVRLQQVESSRLEDPIAKFNALSAKEKAVRRKDAETIAKEALELYRNGQYPEAQAKFEKAIELDPVNRAYYFQYGVTLYKTENFNRSLVYLNLAEGPTVNQAEKDYYTALNHLQLKEYGNALQSFEKVVAANDPDLSPSAQLYKGIIFFDQKKWEEAKVPFQAVLDTSRDPKMDERAEAYLEQILRLQQFEAERARKWQLSATVGEMFDSNVLLTSDSLRDQGTASNTEGYRSLLMTSARYRPMYEETKEFAAQLDLLTMYTVDKTFKSDQDLRNADPTVATLTLPWTHKGLLFGRGYKFDVVPGYEGTWMSIENNETKLILSSYLLSLNNLLVMNDSWFANYNLEIRKDDALLDASTGDADSSAIKVKFIFSNILFVSDDKSKIMTAEADYTLNQAQGRNSVFNRIDASVGYLQPFYWGTTANAKLAYYNLSYPERTPSARTDHNYTLSLGASKPINDLYSAGLLGSYNINNSDDSSNQYKKFSVMLTFSALWQL